MVTIAQRIETLRTKKNISRPALAAAVGLPRMAIEKFETGRQTPTHEQLKKLADYFGITVTELKEGDGDMSLWMDGAFMDEPSANSTPVYQPKPRPRPAQSSADASGSMLDGLLNNKKLQEALREAALEVLRSPEGQKILSDVVRRELVKRGR